MKELAETIMRDRMGQIGDVQAWYRSRYGAEAPTFDGDDSSAASETG